MVSVARQTAAGSEFILDLSPQGFAALRPGPVSGRPLRGLVVGAEPFYCGGLKDVETPGLRRSQRSLARGERFLRTPGADAIIRDPAPAGREDNKEILSQIQ